MVVLFQVFKEFHNLFWFHKFQFNVFRSAVASTLASAGLLAVSTVFSVAGAAVLFVTTVVSAAPAQRCSSFLPALNDAPCLEELGSEDSDELSEHVVIVYMSSL